MRLKMYKWFLQVGSSRKWRKTSQKNLHRVRAMFFNWNQVFFNYCFLKIVFLILVSCLQVWLAGQEHEVQYYHQRQARLQYGQIMRPKAPHLRLLLIANFVNEPFNIWLLGCFMYRYRMYRFGSVYDLESFETISNVVHYLSFACHMDVYSKSTPEPRILAMVAVAITSSWTIVARDPSFLFWDLKSRPFNKNNSWKLKFHLKSSKIHRNGQKKTITKSTVHLISIEKPSPNGFW